MSIHCKKLLKYFRNILQLLSKYYPDNCPNIVQSNDYIFFKCFTNISKILTKYGPNIFEILSRYCLNISQIMSNYCPKKCQYIVQIRYEYFTNIAQTHVPSSLISRGGDLPFSLHQKSIYEGFFEKIELRK